MQLGKVFLVSVLSSAVLVGCSSNNVNALFRGDIPPADQSVTDSDICLATYIAVANYSDKVDEFAKELNRRNIETKKCSRYVVQYFGGPDKMCNDFNHAYVRGENSVGYSPSLPISVLAAVQEDLSINCNTARFIKHYYSPSEQRAREEVNQTWNKAAETWGRVLGGKL